MKKRLAIILAAVTVLAMLSGCSIVKSKGRYNPDRYVDLAEYKGIEIDKVEVNEVTQDDIDTYVREALSKYATPTEITDRGAELWDTLNIDFVGTLNGEAFDGGTGQDYDLTLGSNAFIPGFEDGLLGAKVGEKRDLNLTFPEDYSKVYEELNGQAVVFAVTVNSITEQTLPEITPEFAQENLGADSEEAYLEGVKQILTQQNENAAKLKRGQAVWAKVYENTTIKGYPKSESKELYDEKYAYFKQYAANYGVSMADLAQQVYGMTEDEFNNQVLSWVYEELGYSMVVHAIAAKEGINVSSTEYKKGYAEHLLAAGYASENDFIQDAKMTFEDYYGKEKLEDDILADKVLAFLAENAVEK